MQGISQALFEEVAFDDGGTLLTGNFATYAIPTIDQAPWLESYRTETPSPNNPAGIKGAGEAGATGSTPAVANAVADALAHLGVELAVMPFTPERVWTAIRRARG
jgi:carbon-monoxide dehydrogenase large subunit